jgi:hypothetical protein
MEVNLSWCDKLASTPVAGFTLEPHFASCGAVADAFAPILDSLAEGERQHFSLDQCQNFSFGYTSEDGFQTAVEPAKIAVSFIHRLKYKAVGGGPPTVEMLSRARPFTELLPVVLDKLIQAALVLPGPKERTTNRIGIVSVTGVDENDAPPGIRRFIDYMSKPWGGNTSSYTFNIASTLASTSNWSDRCIHTLAKGEGADALLNISIDWQRTFVTGRSLNEKSLSEVAGEAKKAALSYFEDLAEGSRFDVDASDSQS